MLWKYKGLHMSDGKINTVLDRETARRLLQNAREMTGKTWDDVVQEHEAEVAEMRREAGLRPGQRWGERRKGEG